MTHDDLEAEQQIDIEEALQAYLFERLGQVEHEEVLGEIAKQCLTITLARLGVNDTAQRFTIASGNICDGMAFYGVFGDQESAIEHAEQNFDSWDIIPIEPTGKTEEGSE